MRILVHAILLAVLLATSSCTLEQAVIGAGAAGVGGYLLGRESQPRHEYRHYNRCEHRGNHATCWD